MPVIFITCSLSEYNLHNNAPTDPAIQEYFDRFETEASFFGLEFDVAGKNIYGIISDLDSNRIGNCSFSKNHPRRITIDREYWDGANDMEREYVIFHELGHCYLERIHDNSKSGSGMCRSIMQSGESDCYLIYNGKTRDYYLKELFNRL